LGCVLKGRGLVLVGGGLVVGLGVLTALRAPVFLSEEALWTDTLVKNSAAWCAHANLGWILASQQKYDAARERLVASLALRPDNAQAHNNLGRVLSLQGNFAEAEGHFLEAVRQLRELLQLNPDTEARSQLAARGIRD
jgi:Flp pilus assembly protein TadD